MTSVFAIYLFIWYNQWRLDDPAFQDKFGKLTQGIHLTRLYSNIYYFPNFLVRRLIFIMIPIFTFNYPTQGLQLWLLMTVFYLIYFDGSTRFILRRDNVIYNINDFFGLVQIYHYMCFTDFNRDKMKQFELGFTMVISMALMMAINVGVMIWKSVTAGRRVKRLNAIKKHKLAVFESLQEKNKVLQKMNQLKAEEEKVITDAMKEWKRN